MPAKIDQWISLKDFRAGIKGRVLPAQVSRRPDEVIGVAAPTGTYACQALPDGSLGPMPKNTSSLTITPPIDPTLTTTGRLTISGYERIGPIETGDEAHIAFEAKKAADSRRYYWWQRIRTWDLNQVDSLMTLAPTSLAAGVSSNTRPTFFNGFRAHATDPTQPGLPGVVAGWFEQAGGSSTVWHMFPNPSTPTVDTPVQISASKNANPSVVHQGRAVIFSNGSYAHGANSFQWTHNEDVFMTKANLTTLQSTTASTYGAENASGYMAAVSANYQELLAMKIVGGGMLIRGDLANPTVLRIPGLPSVTRHTPAVSPAGIVMLDSIQTGAWLWSGAETADNISHDALDGTLFDMGRAGATGGEGQEGTDFIDYCGRCIYWEDWVLFPNGWAWNYKENTWWRLDNPANVRPFHYGVSVGNAPRLHAVPAFIKANSNPISYRYDYGTAAQTYKWTSQPLPLGNDRYYQIRELVLIATGNGTITLTLTKLNGTTEAHVFTINSSNVAVLARDNCSVDCQTLDLTIDVTTASVNVPIIHEIRFGVSQMQHYQLNS